MKKTLDLNERVLKKRLLRLAAMGICAAVLATGIPSGVVTTAYAETVADDTTGDATDVPTDDSTDEPAAAQKQEITVEVANKKITGDSIKKAKKTFKIGASAMTDISYEVMNGSKYVSVSKMGVVTVKKNTPADTYKIKVTAQATEEYQKAETTVTVTVTKPTPKLKKSYITWDLKENKAVKFSMDCLMAHGGDSYSNVKTGTVTLKNLKKVSKGNKYKLTFTLECTMPTNFSKKEVDDILNVSYGYGVNWFGGVCDYQTGKDLEEKNSFKVKVKRTEWKNSGRKDYYGSRGNSYFLPKISTMNVTVTYPKEYKDLCIVAGGCRSYDLSNGFDFTHKTKNAKSYFHGMRVK